jgi:hypothetical protein
MAGPKKKNALQVSDPLKLVTPGHSCPLILIERSSAVQKHKSAEAERKRVRNNSIFAFTLGVFASRPASMNRI